MKWTKNGKDEMLFREGYSQSIDACNSRLSNLGKVFFLLGISGLEVVRMMDWSSSSSISFLLCVGVIQGVL